MGSGFFGRILANFTHFITYPFSIDSHRGALTSLYCATSPEIEQKDLKDRYFVPIAKERPEGLTSVAKDDALAQKLWEFTESLVKKALDK